MLRASEPRFSLEMASTASHERPSFDLRETVRATSEHHNGVFGGSTCTDVSEESSNGFKHRNDNDPPHEKAHPPSAESLSTQVWRTSLDSTRLHPQWVLVQVEAEDDTSQFASVS